MDMNFLLLIIGMNQIAQPREEVGGGSVTGPSQMCARDGLAASTATGESRMSQTRSGAIYCRRNRGCTQKDFHLIDIQKSTNDGLRNLE